MMMLKRGGNLVLGFTDENLRTMQQGHVLRIQGSEVQQPGMTLYFLHATNDDEMRKFLRANGYSIDEDEDEDEGGGGDGGNGGAGGNNRPPGGMSPPASLLVAALMLGAGFLGLAE